LNARFSTRQLMTLACLMACPFGFAQTYWLTVLGDPLDIAVDTVEVDPRPVAVNAHLRTMRVRVNRAAPRASREGVPYRSFDSQVVFDCANMTARYAAITYYMLPTWQGPSHKTSLFPESQPRWVEFRSLQPNPTARIIRAACQSR
jgi:hypothetical protein